MKDRYFIGLDYGTLSARAVVIDASHGTEIADSIFKYPDGAITGRLPHKGIELPPDCVLQNPRDYIDAAFYLLHSIWRKAGIQPDQVVSIGVAFTASTCLPVDKDMQPLCFDEKLKDNPHSWVKLWKHHRAKEVADLINQTASIRGENFLERYGGTSSSEWLFSKLIEIFYEAPGIYQRIHKFMEAGDWLVGKLTGNFVTSSCMAGFKAFWSQDDGYPTNDFFRALDPMLENIVAEKILQRVLLVGQKAGGLNAEVASATGLPQGLPVSVSIIDAHASVPATGIAESGSLLLVMGTSLCHILLADTYVPVKGISGIVKDGVIPGYYSYEAGQAAVGDIYDWFMKSCVSCDYVIEAEKRQISIFQLMNEKVSKLEAGESGLVALDWWNGNRSTLNDANLSGLILGCTLSTKPEDIYRSLIEATAFGTRVIIDNLLDNNIMIDHYFACGGLSRKSGTIMQIFADILGKEIYVSNVEQTTAYGAAIYGAVAAGREGGGFASVEEAVFALTRPSTIRYLPQKENQKVYSALYEIYRDLYEYFGNESSSVMRTVKMLRDQCDTLV